MIHSVFKIKLRGTKQIFVRINWKYKNKIYFCVRGTTTPSISRFNTVSVWIKHLKLLFNYLVWKSRHYHSKTKSDWYSKVNKSQSSSQSVKINLKYGVLFLHVILSKLMAVSFFNCIIQMMTSLWQAAIKTSKLSTCFLNVYIFL